MVDMYDKLVWLGKLPENADAVVPYDKMYHTKSFLDEKPRVFLVTEQGSLRFAEARPFGAASSENFMDELTKRLAAGDTETYIKKYDGGWKFHYSGEVLFYVPNQPEEAVRSTYKAIFKNGDLQSVKIADSSHTLNIQELSGGRTTASYITGE